MDGSYMTKRNYGIAYCSNTYECPATGILIKSKCAYRLHKKKCPSCENTPMVDPELFGRRYTQKAVDSAEIAQRNIHMDGPWK